MNYHAVDVNGIWALVNALNHNAIHYNLIATRVFFKESSQGGGGGGGGGE